MIVRSIKVFFALILLLSLIAISLITWVNPNHYKATIAEQISKAIDREVIINGDLNWHLTPQLAVLAHDVKVQNKKTFGGTLANISKLEAHVSLKKLLKREIHVKKIELTRPEIFLVVKPNSQDNFSDEQSGAGQPKSKIVIHNGTVHIKNNLTKSETAISKLSLKAMPINAAFQFKHKTAQGTFSGGASYSGTEHKGQVIISNLVGPNLRVGRLASPVTFSATQVKLSAIEAKLYGGTGTGSLDITQHKGTPGVALNIKLRKVNAQQFLSNMLGLKKLSGTADIDANIKSRAGVRSLNGTLGINISNGAITGVDLPELVNMAVAIFKSITPSKVKAGRTNFSNLRANATIQNGVLNNSDLILTSTRHRVSGQGTVNLNNEKVNYRLLIQAPKTSKHQVIANLQELLGGSIPVIVKGTGYQNITASPDVPAILQAKTKAIITTPIAPVKEGVKGIINIFKGKKTLE